MSDETGIAPARPHRRGMGQKIAGIVLSVAGFFWLAKKAGWIPVDHSHPSVLWPIVVIAIGLLVIFRAGHRAGKDRTA